MSKCAPFRVPIICLLLTSVEDPSPPEATYPLMSCSVVTVKVVPLIFSFLLHGTTVCSWKWCWLYRTDQCISNQVLYLNKTASPSNHTCIHIDHCWPCLISQINNEMNGYILKPIPPLRQFAKVTFITLPTDSSHSLLEKIFFLQ